MLFRRSPLRQPLRPFGNISNADLLSMWSFRPQQDFACQLTAFFEGAAFSGTLLMPQASINIFPTAVATSLKPLGLLASHATYKFDSFVCRLNSQLTLKTVVGEAEADVSYCLSEDVQTPVIGAPGMTALRIAWCPGLSRVVNSKNDILVCGRIPLRPNTTS